MFLDSVLEEWRGCHLVFSFQEDLQRRGEWEAAIPLYHVTLPPAHSRCILSDWLAGRDTELRERMWLLFKTLVLLKDFKKMVAKCIHITD